MAWGQFVEVGGRRVADALLPWSGEPRPAEAPNQPLYIRVTVPRDAGRGIVHGAGGRQRGRTHDHYFQLSVLVSPVVLPEAAIPTSFHVSPATYLAAGATLVRISRCHNSKIITPRALLSDYGLLLPVVGIR